MPPPLWIWIEMLFGVWVFLNRRKVFRALSFLLFPPSLETEELPHLDKNPTLTGIFVGAFIGLLIANFGMWKPIFFTLGSIAVGAVLGSFAFGRGRVHSLAPSQPWRVLTEELAARAGMGGITVRMTSSKDRAVRGSHKGVVTLPSALLRNALKDELAFHIGRALWDIHSGYASKQYKTTKINIIFQMIIVFLVHFTMQNTDFYLPGIFVAISGIFFTIYYIRLRLDSAIRQADRFALRLMGDLPAALRAIEAETKQRSQSMPLSDVRVRIEHDGRRRTESLERWWAAQQNSAYPATPVWQAAPQVQRLGGP